MVKDQSVKIEMVMLNLFNLSLLYLQMKSDFLMPNSKSASHSCIEEGTTSVIKCHLNHFAIP